MKTKNLATKILLTFSFLLLSTVSFAQWQIQSSTTTQDLNDVYFADNEHGWIVGDEGIILNTENGGITWNAQESGTDFDIESVYFINQDTGWIAGKETQGYPDQGIIIRTINGGVDWQEMYYDSLYSFRDVTFIDKQNGWAVGHKPVFFGNTSKVIRTSDGGETWEELQIFGVYIMDMHFADTLRGWAVGGLFVSTQYPHGYIYHTVDGGDTWIAQVNGDYGEAYYGVCFVDSVCGWAVAGCGNNEFTSIRHTTDGGEIWDFQNSITKRALTDVYFTNSLNGWAVGGHSTYSLSDTSIIIHTNDGGNEWNYQTYPTTQALKSVFFTDADCGWIVGEGGTILHTHNGGITAVEEDQFTGHQNRIQLHSFPNPFSSYTTIEFELREPGKAEIKIYNQTGRLIEEILQEEAQMGKSKFIWQANNLPSGIYFVRLQTGKKRVTKRIIKLR